jgi:uncharacterized repeat protein (TIGR01451 family)
MIVLSSMAMLAAIAAQQPDFAQKTTAASRQSRAGQGGQNSADGVWARAGENALRESRGKQLIAPKSFSAVRLDRGTLESLLDRAPVEFTEAAREHPVEMTLPMPDGSFERFRIELSPIMDQRLAARFPEIKTFQARGLDDPSAFARFDWSSNGFNALILRSGDDVQIAPLTPGNTADHLSYFLKDVPAAKGIVMGCSPASPGALQETMLKISPGAVAITNGANLRRYDLAVAATDAWTNQYGGGTVNGAITAINTIMNQVNAIYQRELSVRMDLIANNDQIVYTTANPSSGVYSDNNGNNASGTTNGENQTNIDNVIGGGNYDIGHLFGVFNSGATFAGFASIGVVCGGSKARGSSMFSGGLTTNAFNLYVVAHEIAHQFGADHTFNDSCGGNRNGATAWEPDSGSTIMSYGSSNCSNTTPGLQANASMYFHAGSLIQMINYINGSGGCATTSASGNNPPALNAGPNFTIPIGTPFTLTATGSDADGDAVTFNWEQYDTGAQSPPNTDDGSRPIFRSFPPAASASRTFPSLQYILNNANNPPATVGGFVSGESLPSTNRTMNFQVVARDNRADGAINTASMQVTVTTTSGPFRVTQPNTPVSWPVGSSQNIAWDVAGTTGAPVSAANVRILLSTDGGFNFPIVIAGNTPNDGSESFVVPNAITTQARIKVEAAGNIFFDISDTNFTIAPSADLEVVSKSGAPDPVLTGSVLTYTITVRNNGPTLANNVTVADNLPFGAIFNGCNSTGTGVCGGSSQNRTVTFATLAAGATETITLTTEANCALADGALIDNTATIGSADFDPNPANNSKSVTVTAMNPPPVIDCPADFDAVAATPGSTTAIVAFADPAVMDNCPGATVACVPPSGSSFPLGVTTVNCTATDSGGAMASCSFEINVWDVCIQDEMSEDYLLFNSFTGDYKFVKCGLGGFVMTGRGVVTREGCITRLRDDTRVVSAWFDRCHIAPKNSGGATIKRWQPDTSFVLNDRNILNNTPACAGP